MKLRRSTVLLKAALLAGIALPGTAFAAPAITPPTPSAAVPPALTLLDLDLLGADTSAAPADPSRTIRPYYGNINAFYGTINAFYGNINAFYGNINAFYGNINAFYGNINAFYGNINAFWGDINSVYGNMAAFADGTATIDGYAKPQWTAMAGFWGGLTNQWVALDSQWSAAAGTQDYGAVAGGLRGLVDTSRNFWGAAVQSRTGKSFDDGFANPLFARFGIDPNDPNSLASLDAATRQRFYISWYDQLMNYAGADHVDWWMKAVNWSPALTTTLGSAKRATIGLLDFSITGNATLSDNVSKFGGVSTFSNGHGTAVAGLMVAPIDGTGVMGIAPNATVVAYNPFDASGTSNWDDITKGVLMLSKSGAGIVNMSLGIPGWTFNPGWNQVFTNSDVKKVAQNTVFVIAAGNSGVSQTENVKWDFDKNPEFLLVGSVDPNGTISNFSNRPGTACLIDKSSKCVAGNELMNRFIVAPGELLLVADDSGGITRMSGTSFAAPLVSGTIALMQGRWPWLVNYPAETVSIVLKSAKDLGAPGVDPVYGVGELDVTAALSPLDPTKLVWYAPGPLGSMVPTTAKMLQTTGSAAKWEANGVYVTLFEKIGNTQRDFAVPLSSRLYGQSVTSADGSKQMLMSYLTGRALGWLGQGGASGFASFAERTAPVGVSGDVEVTTAMAPRAPVYGFRDGRMPYQTSVRVAAADGKAGFRMGVGDGAVALGQRQGLAMISDYDVDAGGANPLLGMASGGAYATADARLSPTIRVSAGYTDRNRQRDTRTLGMRELTLLGGTRDAASAQHVSIEYRPASALTLTAAMTHLAEDNAVLGVRSLDPNDFAKGSASDGVTMGADIALGHGLGLAVSATRARTRDRGGADRNLSLSGNGLTTSAYEVAVSAANLFDRRDSIRFAVSQPMYVEAGRFDFSSVEVIDRDTGEIGVVSRSFAPPREARMFVGEMLYGRSFNGGMGEIQLFGRAQLRPSAAAQGTPALMAGTRVSFGF
ncbi:S8 family serine peptidase [Sphingomonas sp. BIUV-7]|uniref:S8 family serine peptidase n=1 Tax=Sphingomonas natans TaxID=3063330 RepID=A0ABT8Y982_9SPHN|nr:S8 family serine peptidase [Sphingomonas sp. BIUV-7]MDO6414893.1 S8 family serine peptidase [Sphingomonas sp. BIUV-7]